MSLFSPLRPCATGRGGPLASPADTMLTEEHSRTAYHERAASHVGARTRIDHRPQPAVRLGLNRVQGLSRAAAIRLVEARAVRVIERGITADTIAFAFDGIEDLARCAALDRHSLQMLAGAGALQALAGHRASAYWEAAAITPMPALLADARFDEDPVLLTAPTEGEETVADYTYLGVPMGRHPMQLLRPHLERFGVQPSSILRDYPNGRLARASGLVTHRQRPETAKGTIFVTLEDETGPINVIVWKSVRIEQRDALLRSRLLAVYGQWQRDEASGNVRHLIAHRLQDLTPLLGRLGQQSSQSRDFH